MNVSHNARGSSAAPVLDMVPYVTLGETRGPAPNLRASLDPSPRAPFAAKARALGLGALGLGALALGALALGAALWAYDNLHASRAMSAQNAGAEQLAQDYRSLKARLDLIDSAHGREEVAELKKTVAELKNAVAATREAQANAMQLAPRLDHAERDLAKLADNAARLDRADKKPAAAPVVSAAPPVISHETTASISASRPVIRDWALLEVRDDGAIVEGRSGFRQVAVGDNLPGAGRVEKIEHRASGWVVRTSIGDIIGGVN